MRNPTAPDTRQATAYPRDELDDLVDQAAASLNNSADWKPFFNTLRHN